MDSSFLRTVTSCATAALLVACWQSKYEGEAEGTLGQGEDKTLWFGSARSQTPNIRQNTQTITMPGPIAPTQSWTLRPSGLCGNSCRNGPRHMYTTAYRDQLLVSWMTVDPADPAKQVGNVATFRVDPQGKFTLVRNVSLKGMCQAAYGITANADGSVIGVLCQGATASTSLIPGAIDLLKTRRTAGCVDPNWEGTCYPIGNYSAIDSGLYLLEYTQGGVMGMPSSIVHVNHAVGGWNMGHHELSLNAAADTYFVQLKVTAGPTLTNRHEGLTYFGLRRKPFAYVRVTGSEWGCGAGHVEQNRIGYSPSRNTWAQLCRTDYCATPSQYQDGACGDIAFQTVPGVTPQGQVTPGIQVQTEALLEIARGRNDWELPAALSGLLSLGNDGWLALAAGPGYPGITPSPDTIGLLRIPTTVDALRARSLAAVVPKYQDGVQVGTQTVRRYPWNWLYLPAPDPTLNRPARVGMAAMAYFDTRGEASQRLLVGWSPTIAFQGIAREYVVSEMDRRGRLRGSALRLRSAGWGEDNLWTTMPNSGCVVFPFAWVGSEPGADYPTQGTQSSGIPAQLRLTSLCPATTTQPSLAATPPKQTDRERWSLP